MEGIEIMKSKKFKIQELVPLKLYETVHEDLLWGMLDDRLLMVVDRIKDRFSKGTMTINSWYWNGDRGWSGIRTKDSPYYSEGSQHSKGKAIDAIFSEYEVDEVRKYILSNLGEFPEIGGVELGVNWLHVDVRPKVNGEVLLFTA